MGAALSAGFGFIFTQGNEIISGDSGKTDEILANQEKILVLLEQAGVGDHIDTENPIIITDELQKEINDAFRKIEGKIPVDVSFLIKQGVYFYYLGEYEKSMETFDQILLYDEKNISSLNNKGVSLFELGKYEEAIELFDRALEIEPNDVNALYNNGVLLGKIGKYEKAIELFDRVLEIEPNDVNALNGKNISLEYLEEIQEIK